MMRSDGSRSGSRRERCRVRSSGSFGSRGKTVATLVLPKLPKLLTRHHSSKEDDAHRLVDRHRLTDWRELSGVRVHAVDREVRAFLIAHDEPVVSGVER